MKCPLSYNPKELTLMKLSCIGDSGTSAYRDNLEYVVSSRNICDFVVWTQKGLYEERI